MPDISEWSEAERDDFCHKLETLIHGPAPTRKIGFILATFPVEEFSRASIHANCNQKMVATVLYNVLKGLVERGAMHDG